jgi:tRNA (cmo5U34)-methyltransferase
MMDERPTWSEEVSTTFIDYGRYFVPDRTQQMETICRLIPPLDGPFVVMELAHGEGLLAETILARFDTAVVHGYDISPQMRQTAVSKLARFDGRFHSHYFDLREHAWRKPDFRPQAIVTSLTVHHLDGPEKQQLFRDMHAILAPGGAFIIADLIEPANGWANTLAADAWDEAVREQTQQLDGNTDRFAEFERLEWNLFRHPDPDFDKPSRLVDQLHWLEAAGFTAVDVYWLRAGHAIFGGYKEM